MLVGCLGVVFPAPPRNGSHPPTGPEMKKPLQEIESPSERRPDPASYCRLDSAPPLLKGRLPNQKQPGTLLSCCGRDPAILAQASDSPPQIESSPHAVRTVMRYNDVTLSPPPFSTSGKPNPPSEEEHTQ
eukprot:gene25436-33984_t